MLRESRISRKLYEKFFQERADWYARRNLPGARTRQRPAPSTTPPDADELVQLREADSLGEALQPPPDGSGPSDTTLLNEVDIEVQENENPSDRDS